jgi:hypothetical protein
MIDSARGKVLDIVTNPRKVQTSNDQRHAAIVQNRSMRRMTENRDDVRPAGASWRSHVRATGIDRVAASWAACLLLAAAAGCGDEKGCGGCAPPGPQYPDGIVALLKNSSGVDPVLDTLTASFPTFVRNAATAELSLRGALATAAPGGVVDASPWIGQFDAYVDFLAPCRRYSGVTFRAGDTSCDGGAPAVPRGPIVRQTFFGMQADSLAPGAMVGLKLTDPADVASETLVFQAFGRPLVTQGSLAVVPFKIAIAADVGRNGVYKYSLVDLFYGEVVLDTASGTPRVACFPLNGGAPAPAVFGTYSRQVIESRVATTTASHGQILVPVQPGAIADVECAGGPTTSLYRTNVFGRSEPILDASRNHYDYRYGDHAVVRLRDNLVLRNARVEDGKLYLGGNAVDVLRPFSLPDVISGTEIYCPTDLPPGSQGALRLATLSVTDAIGTITGCP